MFYELAVSTWGAEEIAAIQRVIASDRFTIGPQRRGLRGGLRRLPQAENTR